MSLSCHSHLFRSLTITPASVLSSASSRAATVTASRSAIQTASVTPSQASGAADAIAVEGMVGVTAWMDVVDVDQGHVHMNTW